MRNRASYIAGNVVCTIAILLLDCGIDHDSLPGQILVYVLSGGYMLAALSAKTVEQFLFSGFLLTVAGLSGNQFPLLLASPLYMASVYVFWKEEGLKCYPIRVREILRQPLRPSCCRVEDRDDARLRITVPITFLSIVGFFVLVGGIYHEAKHEFWFAPCLAATPFLVFTLATSLLARHDISRLQDQFQER